MAYDVGMTHRVYSNWKVLKLDWEIRRNTNQKLRDLGEDTNDINVDIITVRT